MNIPERDHVTGYHEQKEHGGREFPFNIYPCSIPLDFPQVPVHWHEEMELISARKGRGMVVVDTEPYQLAAGELIVVFPGQLHGIFQDGDFAMEYENIIFRPEMLMRSGADVCTLEYLLPLVRESSGPPLVLRKGNRGHKELMECVGRLDEISERREFGYELAVKGQLFWLFFEICQCLGPADRERPARSRERIKELLAYLEGHYGEPLTVEQAAAVCGYSSSHFMKYFKQYMGSPFIRYLNDYRLARAAGYLKTTREPVTAVALRCGFENLSYFNRLFKRRFGMTPGEFRKSR